MPVAPDSITSRPEPLTVALLVEENELATFTSPATAKVPPVSERVETLVVDPLGIVKDPLPTASAVPLASR
jgi:hypothetical protein